MFTPEDLALMFLNYVERCAKGEEDGPMELRLKCGKKIKIVYEAEEQERPALRLVSGED